MFMPKARLTSKHEKQIQSQVRGVFDNLGGVVLAGISASGLSQRRELGEHEGRIRSKT
jgi:hypothetical protein